MATRSAIVYRGEDMSPQYDYTDWVIWEESEFGTRAYNGEGNTSTVVIRDPLGETGQEHGLPAGLTERHISSKNLMVIKLGSDFLFRGRIGIKNYSRDGQHIERYRQAEVMLHDTNWDLDHIFVHNWVRPAETDVTRARGLISSYMAGSPRPTTHINGSNYISASNHVTLPAKTYTRTSPLGVLQDLGETANKFFFVTGDSLTGGSLFYDGIDSTAYACALSISDREDEVRASSTVFPPIWNVGPASTEDGGELVDEVVTFYGTGEDQYVSAHSDLVHTQYGHSSVTMTYDTEDAALAQARTNAVLAYRRLEDRTYNVTIGPLTDAQVVQVKHGQTISIKARAITDADDIARTMRITQCRYTTPVQGTWFAHLQLGRPWKMGPYGTGPSLSPTVYHDPADATPDGLTDCSDGCLDLFARRGSGTWGTSTILDEPWQTSVSGGPGTAPWIETGRAALPYAVPSGTRYSYLDVGTLDLPFEVLTQIEVRAPPAGNLNGIGPVNGIDAYFSVRSSLPGVVGSEWRFAFERIDADDYGTEIGVSTSIASPTELDNEPGTISGGVYPSHSMLWVRLRGTANDVYMKAWWEGTTEPASWTATTGIGSTASGPRYITYYVISQNDLHGEFYVHYLCITEGGPCDDADGDGNTSPVSGGDDRTSGTSDDAAPIDHDHDYDERIQFHERSIIRDDMFSATQPYDGGLVNLTSGGSIGQTAAQVTASHPGVITVNTGGTATGRAALFSGANTCALGGGEVSCMTVISIFQNLSDATETYTVRSGFIDSTTGDGTDGVFFRYTHSVNGGRWEAVTRSNSTETAGDTGIAADIDTWHRFNIIVNAAGTSAEFYIDGTLVRTITTNIPTGTSRLTALCPISIIKSAGTTSRQVLFDAYAYTFEFNTPR